MSRVGRRSPVAYQAKVDTILQSAQDAAPAQDVDDKRWDARTADHCPGCGYYQGCMHAGDLHAPEDAPAFPCDGSYYRARVEAAKAAMLARYAVGATIRGFHAYAEHEAREYVVTRTQISTKPPSWFKGGLTPNWSRLFVDGWGHDFATVPAMLTDETYPAPKIFFEFKLADRIVQPSLFGAA